MCTGPDGCDDLVLLVLAVGLAALLGLISVAIAFGLATSWRRERLHGPLTRRQRIGWAVLGALGGVGLTVVAVWASFALFPIVLVVPIGAIWWAIRERRARQSAVTDADVPAAAPDRTRTR